MNEKGAPQRAPSLSPRSKRMSSSAVRRTAKDFSTSPSSIARCAYGDAITPLRTFDFQLSTVNLLGWKENRAPRRQSSDAPIPNAAARLLPNMQYRMPQKVAGSKYADQHHSRPQNQPQKRPGQFLLVVSRFSRKNSLSRLVWSGFCSL